MLSSGMARLLNIGWSMRTGNPLSSRSISVVTGAGAARRTAGLAASSRWSGAAFPRVTDVAGVSPVTSEALPTAGLHGERAPHTALIPSGFQEVLP